MKPGVPGGWRAWAGALAVVVAALALVSSASPEQASSKLRRLPASSLDAGGPHSCVVLSDGTVRCWGSGADGELGYRNTKDVGDDEAPGSVGPVDLGTGRKAVASAAGTAHTCALLDDGTVRCWGSGEHGALGYGNTVTIGDDESPASVGPVDLGAGRRAVAITAGSGFTCALLDNGRVRCWGYGAHGELGYGNTNDLGDDETPGSVGPIDLGPGRKAVAVSAGGSHACAVLDSGRVRCWGFGLDGELGYGSTNDVGDDETPGSVAAVDLGAGRKAIAISAGESHTCAVLDNGRVRCWGSGADGELGYGNTDTIGDDETPGSASYVDLGAGRRAIAISAGAHHTCALLDGGAVRCWGAANAGQLGYGNKDTIGDDETPGGYGPVDLIRPAVAVSAGSDHTCAVLDNGRVRCWGQGAEGQLGYANTTTIGDNETPASAGPVVDGGLVAIRLQPRLSFVLTPKRDRRWPYRLRAIGKLTGFLADPATCLGQVGIRATTPRVFARVRWVNLKPAASGCTYAATLTVSGRGSWKVTAAFPGNGSLKGRTAPARRFRAG